LALGSRTSESRVEVGLEGEAPADIDDDEVHIEAEYFRPMQIQQQVSPS
jgi:hypothetical protein